MTSPSQQLGYVDSNGQLAYTPAPWRCLVYLTRTGQIVDELRLVGAPRWSRTVNEAGSVAVGVDVNDLAASEVQSYTSGWRHSLALAWGDGYIAQAGPITAHDDPDDGSGVITIGAVGVRGLLNHRILKSTYTGSIAEEAADLTFGPLSLHTIAKRIVAQGLVEPYCELPLVLPADIPGDQTRYFPGFDLAYVGERLSDVSDEEAGPDVDFAPRFSADGKRVEHDVLIGDPGLPAAGVPLLWDYGQSLLKLPTSSDWTRMAFRVWDRGAGSERDLIVGYAQDYTLAELGWPALDLIASHTSQSDPVVLNSHAAGAIQANATPKSSWQITVLADPGVEGGWPALSEISLGAVGQFAVAGHRTVPDGTYSWRILGMSDGGAPDQVTLTVEDELVAA